MSDRTDERTAIGELVIERSDGGEIRHTLTTDTELQLQDGQTTVHVSIDDLDLDLDVSGGA